LTHWRGQPDTSKRRLGWLVIASTVVHAPFTPLVALLGLFSWLTAKPPAPVEGPPITAIPVDLIEGGEEPGTPAPPPPPAPEAAAPAEPAPKPKPKPKREPADAGAPDSGAPDAEAPDAGPEADAGAGDAGVAQADGGTPNPLASLSGAAKKVVDADANVRLVIYPEKMRTHPLGARVGRMLRSIYQWRDFFGPSGLDPVRDVDRILVVGPELRDSSKVVAILKLNAPGDRVHDAIDAIVRADTEHGEWLDAGVPAATAYADRAPRIFVMPSPNTVVVVPPSAKDAALKLPKNLSIRKAEGPEVLWGYAVTPWRPARMLRLDIPHSIQWAKVWVTPTGSGGATIDVEAEDENADAAERDAAQILGLINQNLAMADAVSSILGGVLGFQAPKLLDKIDLHAEGSKIRGSATLTAGQLELVLGQLEPLLSPRRLPRSPPDAGTSSGGP
jgi:hypothetical protein